MKSIFKLMGAVLTVFINVYAQDFIELSGALPSHLTAEKTYLVIADIFVSPGSSVTIEPGTVFLFESFTGLHVQGTAFIKGEPEKPVIFTSKNDKQWNPAANVDAAPFDWNGIDIYETGMGTSFNQCIIRFSVYGMRSQTEYFKIFNSVFSNNGKADLTINGEKKDVSANVSFSFGLPDSSHTILPQPQQLVPMDTVQGKPEIVVESPDKPRHKTRTGIQILRYTSLAVAIGSGAATAWYYDNRYKAAKQNLENLSELDNYERRKYTSKDWENAEKERNRKLGLCIVGAGGAFVGVGIFVLSFAF